MNLEEKANDTNHHIQTPDIQRSALLRDRLARSDSKLAAVIECLEELTKPCDAIEAPAAAVRVPTSVIAVQTEAVLESRCDVEAQTEPEEHAEEEVRGYMQRAALCTRSNRRLRLRELKKNKKKKKMHGWPVLPRQRKFCRRRSVSSALRVVFVVCVNSGRGCAQRDNVR